MENTFLHQKVKEKLFIVVYQQEGIEIPFKLTSYKSTSNWGDACNADNSVIFPDSSVKIGFEAKPGNTLEPSTYKLISSGSDDMQEDDEFDINNMDFEIDSDQDGLADDVEDYIGTDKLSNDSDGDSVEDGLLFR